MDILSTDDGEEFTRLSDFHPDRVDLVKNAANGTRFLIAKQDAGTGLLDPEFVRDLIAKSPEEAPVPETEAGRTVLPNGIHLSGSPSAMAAFIHAANVRKGDDRETAEAEDGDVAKAKNDTADREKKAATGAAMPDGSYPVASEADLTKAIHAVGRGGDSHNAVRKHIIARAKSLGASSKIPDNWNPDGSLKGDVSKEAGVPDAVTKDLMASAGDATALDDGIDGLDPTVPLAAPDDELDLPGDPTDPGSPAWEGIDAASAQKWLSIAARLKNALGVLAERETLEAASADPDDIENAWNLQDAMSAVDFAIEQLAVFAAGEQAEAELGAECEEMCKALAAVDLAPLGVLESLAPASAAVRKAGRVLSSANEAKLRSAAQAIGEVLSSLPQAPDGVAKSKEAPVPAGKDQAADVAKERTPEEQARDTGPVQAGGTTGMGAPRATGPDAALPADGPQAALPGDAPGRTVVKSAHLQVLVYDRQGRMCRTAQDAITQPVAKADGDDAEKPKMQAVFDQDGDLIGVVDPEAITPVAGAAAAPAAPDAAPAPAPDDTQPQPPADAGTPADAVGKSAAAPAPAQPGVDLDAVFKALADTQAASAARQAEALELVAKSVAAGNAGLAAEFEVLKARLKTVEEHPAAPGVFANGQVPPEGARPVPPPGQLRGQDAGQPVDVAKAAERKRELYSAPDAPARDAIAKEMNGDALAVYSAIRAAGPTLTRA